MEFDMNALDSLLDGKTIDTEPNPETDPVEPTTEEPEGTEKTDPTDGGGQNNLESPNEPGQEGNKEPEEGEGSNDKSQATTNAAFARLRTENKKYAKTIQQLADALKIEEKDPEKLGDALVNMAQARLAKEANLPVEVYKELTSTKEQLEELRMQQNAVTAREKFAALKAEFELDDKALIQFASTLDNEGVNLIQNPDMDLAYEYYRRNRKELEEKRIAKAVEEALRKSNTAESKSSTPGKQQGKKQEQEGKINNVSALNDLLNSK